MFYDTRLNNHGLRYNPFKACVVPRPIAWISTCDENGVVNLGPYSYFNAVADIPPVIMFSSSKKSPESEKDSLRNIRLTGEFVVNLVTYEMKELMQQSSAAFEYGVSEAEQLGIEMIPSTIVKPPRIAKSPIQLECQYISEHCPIINDTPMNSIVVFGHVVGIHIKEDLIEDGRVNMHKLQAIARLGYDEYALIDNIFSLKKP